MAIIFQNGNFIPDNEAQISVYNRSFLFGEGLFETFRSYDGQIPFLNDHINRLEWSSTFLSIDFPTETDFGNVCQILLDKNNLKDAIFKIHLSQASHTFRDHPDDHRHIHLIIYCEAFDPHKIKDTFKLKVITNYKNDTLPLASMKTSNSLVKIMGRFEAQDSGFDDGILLNSQNQVTETTRGNIFWVDKDAKLRMILEEQGYLSGVMQKNLLALLKEKKVTIHPSMVTPNELSNSREVFVTNSIMGIKPVITINDRQISGGETGPITLMIMDLWEKYFNDLLTAK